MHRRVHELIGEDYDCDVARLVIDRKRAVAEDRAVVADHAAEVGEA